MTDLRSYPVIAVMGVCGTQPPGRGFPPTQGRGGNRCHSAVCNETKNQKGGIAFPACVRAQRALAR